MADLNGKENFPDLSRDVGMAIGRALTAAGKTRQELASEAGVSSGYISMVTKGRKPPSAKVVEAALRLGLTIQIGPSFDESPEPDDIAGALMVLAGRLRAEGRGHRGPLHDLLAEVLEARPEVENKLRGMLEMLLPKED